MTRCEEETLRYLGVRNDEEEHMLREVRRCMPVVMGNAKTHSVHQRFACAVDEQGVELGGLRLESRSLARHLRGCDQAVVLAATLGLSVDRLIHSGFLSAAADAVIHQACAAALLESACDTLQPSLVPPGLFTRSRFSPGYGDLALTCQGALLQMVHASQRIGLNETASHMLVPTKSIVAIIGLCDSPDSEQAGSCTGCEQTECPFRK